LSDLDKSTGSGKIAGQELEIVLLPASPVLARLFRTAMLVIASLRFLCPINKAFRCLRLAAFPVGIWLRFM
jgi:hypothetical protein